MRRSSNDHQIKSFHGGYRDQKLFSSVQSFLNLLDAKLKCQICSTHGTSIVSVAKRLEIQYKLSLNSYRCTIIRFLIIIIDLFVASAASIDFLQVLKQIVWWIFRLLLIFSLGKRL